MQKERILNLILLGFLFSILVFQFVEVVSAQSVFDKIFGSGGSVDSVITKYASGDNFAKILLFLLVALVIYALGDFVPFMANKPLINGAISVIIALLSTVFLTSQEIYSILLAYSALGIVITGMIPFFAIAAIQFKAYQKGHHYLSKLLWIVYIIVIAIKWFSADLAKLGYFGTFAYPVLAIAALGLFIWEAPLFKLLVRDAAREKIEHYAREAKLAKEEQKISAAKIDENINKYGTRYE